MNKVIISNYIKTVAQEDTCYFLGDMAMVGPANSSYLEGLMKHLPGRKILILGNHDRLNPFTYMDIIGFESVHTILDIGEFILVHDPAIATGLNDRKWLVGHVHTVFKMAKNRTVLNVGVDQWGFFPVSIEEVRREFERII
jgi:calcineurin-like phosphoesterase family protein